MEEVFSFLEDHENFSLFLLGNLEAYGPKLIAAPNSGNFKLIRCEGKVVAVFSLTRRGNLVVQSSLVEGWIFGKILDACREEYLPILGLIGEWSFCQKFWSLLKQKGIIDWSSARGGFAEEDFCPLEFGEWSTHASYKQSFLDGYAKIRKVPDYHRILPLLRLSRAIGAIGFTVKRGTWEHKSSKIYQFNRQYLEESL